jgi:signal transduction histidine kinase
MNAFRHAGAKEQCVSAWADHATVSVEVSDRGPGMSTDAAPKDRARLGLAGLRSRIESIGGSLTISSCPARGTRLAACLPLTSEA